MASRPLKVNDRVKRANGIGCMGIIKEVRVETTSSRSEVSDKAAMINVLWDNGTLSYLSPEALELEGEK